jgi:hypothetical protein
MGRFISRSIPLLWRDGRVAEGARLESVFASNRNQGSNPCLSAIFNCTQPTSFYNFWFRALRLGSLDSSQ